MDHAAGGKGCPYYPLTSSEEESSERNGGVTSSPPSPSTDESPYRKKEKRRKLNSGEASKISISTNKEKDKSTKGGEEDGNMEKEKGTTSPEAHSSPPLRTGGGPGMTQDRKEKPKEKTEGKTQVGTYEEEKEKGKGKEEKKKEPEITGKKNEEKGEMKNPEGRVLPFRGANELPKQLVLEAEERMKVKARELLKQITVTIEENFDKEQVKDLLDLWSKSGCKKVGLMIGADKSMERKILLETISFLDKCLDSRTTLCMWLRNGEVEFPSGYVCRWFRDHLKSLTFREPERREAEATRGERSNKEEIRSRSIQGRKEAEASNEGSVEEEEKDEGSTDEEEDKGSTEEEEKGEVPGPPKKGPDIQSV